MTAPVKHRLSTCRRCDRMAICGRAGWLHTDLRPECYDPWYLVPTGAFVDPLPVEAVEPAPPKRKPYNRRPSGWSR